MSLQSIKKEIEKEYKECPECNLKAYNRGVKDTEKAFGGCKKCYGKGYATTLAFAESYEDFGGEKTGRWKLPEMRFCSCDRGKQLKRLIKNNKL